MRYLLLIALFGGLITPSQAEDTHFSNAASDTTVLELYTSEGCSSCPPADRWFSTLLKDPRLFDTLFPVAFHVDYWDYLGWGDRFATADASQRQRRHSLQDNTNGVYTPGMVASGHEWHGWRRGEPLPGIKAVGELAVILDEGVVTAQYYAGRDDNLVLNVAVLGFGLETTVRAGENRGRRLAHDFVVLAHETGRSGNGEWRLNLPQPSAADAQRMALVAWVSPAQRQRPLQAVGGWLEAGQLN